MAVAEAKAAFFEGWSQLARRAVEKSAAEQEEVRVGGGVKLSPFFPPKFRLGGPCWCSARGV